MLLRGRLAYLADLAAPLLYCATCEIHRARRGVRVQAQGRRFPAVAQVTPRSPRSAAPCVRRGPRRFQGRRHIAAGKPCRQ